MPNNILCLSHITKRYPGVTALEDVSMEIREGEIHALVGENGAGKSTLIKTCTGAVIPDEGQIIANGETYSAMSPKLAEKAGIAVIYQELNSVGDLTAAENVFLGNEIRKGAITDKKAMNREAKKIFEQLHVEIDPTILVKDLTVGYRQIVEIAKAISHKARILIMDEPSAPLTNNEVENMLSVVENLRREGVTIIYISHRLNEIFRLSDRVSVLRDGHMITTLETAKTNTEELIRLMIGRELTNTFPLHLDNEPGEVLLEAEHLTGNGDHDISFQLRRGEILGFAGLIGAGRTELAELLFGVKPIESGTLRWNGKEVRFKGPAEAIAAGIYLVPEDRKRQGAVLPMTIQQNVTLSMLDRISKGLVINNKKDRSTAQHFEEKLRIKTPSLAQQVKNLSGGNQQKVVLAKGLATEPELIIFDEPTRGIDVGAKYEIYCLMNELKAEGKTIIMISSEMEEIIGMSDRIIVLAEGHISGELTRDAFSQETIMRYASRELQTME